MDRLLRQFSFPLVSQLILWNFRLYILISFIFKVSENLNQVFLKVQFWWNFFFLKILKLICHVLFLNWFLILLTFVCLVFKNVTLLKRMLSNSEQFNFLLTSWKNMFLMRLEVEWPLFMGPKNVFWCFVKTDKYI